MEDSLDDFIRISRNTKTNKPQPKPNQILVTTQLKKECDAKALQIIQFAIEGKLRSQSLIRCLPFIDQSHYQDIVEERAISKICGYPLCSKQLPDMPKKQFLISTKTNQVYDITDRKNYCSNYCYKASIHVKNQVDTSPLWMRKHEKPYYISFLQRTEKGLPGQLVNQGIVKSVQDYTFTSISSFTKMSLDEAEENEITTQEEPKVKIRKPKKYQKASMKTIAETDDEEDAVDSKNKAAIIDNQETNNIKPNSISQLVGIKENDLVKDCMLRKNKFKENVDRSNETLAAPLTVDIETQIRTAFKKWISLDTFIFIYGEEVIKQKLSSDKISRYFHSIKIADLKLEHKKQYVNICRKLHLRELAEDKFDSSILGVDVLKSIPDYRELKTEAKDIDLKVKSFYCGQIHIRDDINFQKTENVDSEQPAVLPLGDNHSQNALRRKIFLNSFSKVIQDILQNLGISETGVLSDLQSLVKTFSLKANNIVFKPIVWNYIALVLLKVLAIKDTNLKSILDESRSKQYFNLWLGYLPHGWTLVESSLELIEDLDCFVKKYITCNN